jgi:hypothetical protein
MASRQAPKLSSPPENPLSRPGAFRLQNPASAEASPETRHSVPLPTEQFSVMAVAPSWKEDQSKCHNQNQSPLFGALPAELRNQVYDLVLQSVVHFPSVDEIQEGVSKSLVLWGRNQNTASERLGYPSVHSHASIDTALLLTCRLIYLETRLSPIRNVPHIFYRQRGYYPAAGQSNQPIIWR